MVPTVLVCEPPRPGAAPPIPGAPPALRPVKLGRIRPVARPLVPRLSAYFAGFPAATPPPASVDYSAKARQSIIQVYGNDQLGDCVIAGKAHAVGVWSGNDSGTPVVGTTSEAVSEYHRLCGPGDNGCVITDVLDAMKSGGLSVGGRRHKIDGYVAIDPANADEVKVALLVFGGFTIGFEVPAAWMGSHAYDGAVWDDPGPFAPIGGHDVRAVGYNATGVQFATWGFVVTMTWRALANSRIVDEAYVELSPDWYGQDNLAPSGIDAATLRDDLAKLSGGDLPPWQPPSPTPTPTPTPTPVPPGPNPTPTPTPTPPGPAPSYALTLSGMVPTGLFGKPEPVTLTGTATPAAAGGDAGAVIMAALYDPAVQAALDRPLPSGVAPGLAVLQILAALLPVLLADLAAGKPPGQVVADVVAAILAGLEG